jgi:hypothetical protein
MSECSGSPANTAGSSRLRSSTSLHHLLLAGSHAAVTAGLAAAASGGYNTVPASQSAGGGGIRGQLLRKRDSGHLQQHMHPQHTHMQEGQLLPHSYAASGNSSGTCSTSSSGGRSLSAVATYTAAVAAGTAGSGARAAAAAYGQVAPAGARLPRSKRPRRSGPRSRNSPFIGVSQYKRTGRWEVRRGGGREVGVRGGLGCTTHVVTGNTVGRGVGGQELDGVRGLVSAGGAQVRLCRPGPGAITDQWEHTCVQGAGNACRAHPMCAQRCECWRCNHDANPVGDLHPAPFMD